MASDEHNAIGEEGTSETALEQHQSLSASSSVHPTVYSHESPVTSSQSVAEMVGELIDREEVLSGPDF